MCLNMHVIDAHICNLFLKNTVLHVCRIQDIKNQILDLISIFSDYGHSRPQREMCKILQCSHHM